MDGRMDGRTDGEYQEVGCIGANIGAVGLKSPP